MMMMDESIERARCEELAKSSSFYRKVYSEIEEVGWESLRRLGGDLTLFSFHILDNKGRAHILELQLDRDYPKCPPSLSSDVPYMFTLEWSTTSRLKDVMHLFQKMNDHQEGMRTLMNLKKEMWKHFPSICLQLSGVHLNVERAFGIDKSINI
ncbi:hypothetical protein F2Q68_00003826 [Brassica cretica]|uniref:FANCL UBC-like domain-containing protein n=1 Tax=Brassica cretica TaxID=69181 RepID=A0A8S9JFB9_BRACR|nr:hypothetical protein F2Q68_00003826 [Brassica cretica]